MVEAMAGGLEVVTKVPPDVQALFRENNQLHLQMISDSEEHDRRLAEMQSALTMSRKELMKAQFMAAQHKKRCDFLENINIGLQKKVETVLESRLVVPNVPFAETAIEAVGRKQEITGGKLPESAVSPLAEPSTCKEKVTGDEEMVVRTAVWESMKGKVEEVENLLKEKTEDLDIMMEEMKRKEDSVASLSKEVERVHTILETKGPTRTEVLHADVLKQEIDELTAALKMRDADVAKGEMENAAQTEELVAVRLQVADTAEKLAQLKLDFNDLLKVVDQERKEDSSHVTNAEQMLQKERAESAAQISALKEALIETVKKSEEVTSDLSSALIAERKKVAEHGKNSAIAEVAEVEKQPERPAETKLTVPPIEVDSGGEEDEVDHQMTASPSTFITQTPVKETAPEIFTSSKRDEEVEDKDISDPSYMGVLHDDQGQDKESEIEDDLGEVLKKEYDAQTGNEINDADEEKALNAVTIARLQELSETQAIQVGALRAENSKLRESLRDMVQRAEGLSDMLLKKDGELQQVEADAEHLAEVVREQDRDRDMELATVQLSREQLESADDKFRSIVADYEDVRVLLGQKTEQLAEVQKAFDSLGRDNEEMRKHLRIGEGKNQKLMHRLGSIAQELDKKDAEIYQRVAEAQEVKKQVNLRERQVSELSAAIDVARQRENDWAAERELSERDRSVLVNDVANCTRENQVLQREISILSGKGRSASAECAKLKNELQHATEKLKISERDRSDILYSYRGLGDEKARTQRERDSLEIQLAQLNREMVLREKEVSQLRYSLAQSQRELHQSSLDLHTYDQHLQDMSQKVSQMDMRIKELEQERARLIADLQGAAEQQENISKQRIDEAAESMSHYRSIEGLRRQIADVEAEKAILQKEVQQETARALKLEEVVSALRQNDYKSKVDHEDSQHSMHMLLTSLNGLNADQKRWREMQKELQASAAKAEKENEELKRLLSVAEYERDVALHSQDTARTRAQTLQHGIQKIITET